MASGPANTYIQMARGQVPAFRLESDSILQRQPLTRCEGQSVREPQGSGAVLVRQNQPRVQHHLVLIGAFDRDEAARPRHDSFNLRLARVGLAWSTSCTCLGGDPSAPTTTVSTVKA